jgi:hypothetical protein
LFTVASWAAVGFNHWSKDPPPPPPDSAALPIWPLAIGRLLGFADEAAPAEPPSSLAEPSPSVPPVERLDAPVRHTVRWMAVASILAALVAGGVIATRSFGSSKSVPTANPVSAGGSQPNPSNAGHRSGG